MEVESLDIVAARFDDGLKLLLRLHAFDADFLAELVAGVDDARYEVAAVLRVRHFLHQAAVELHDVGRVLQEQFQRGVARAEVVEGETDAELAARLDEGLQGGGAFVVVRLRQLGDEVFALHLVAIERLAHEGQELGVKHLMVADVEVQGKIGVRAVYALGVDDRLLEDPASDGADLLAALKDGDEDARRDVRSLMRPAAQKLAADDAEAVGGDRRLYDRAEVGAAALDILVDGEKEAAEVLACLDILRGKDDVGFVQRFLRQIQEAQHVGDDLRSRRVARNILHESEGRRRLHGESVVGIEVANRLADEVEDRLRIFRDVGRQDGEEAQAVEPVDQKAVAEAVHQPRRNALEERVGKAPAVHFIDLAEVVQAEADEGECGMRLLHLLQLDFRALLARESRGGIDDEFRGESRDAAGDEQRLLVRRIPLQDAAAANPELVSRAIRHTVAQIVDGALVLEEVGERRMVGHEIVGVADMLFPFGEEVLDDVALEAEGVARLIVDVEEVRLQVAEVDVLVGKLDRVEEAREIEEVLPQEGGESALVRIDIDFGGDAARTAQDVPHAEDARDEAPGKIERRRDVMRVVPVGHVGDDESHRIAVLEERDGSEGRKVERGEAATGEGMPGSESLRIPEEDVPAVHQAVVQQGEGLAHQFLLGALVGLRALGAPRVGRSVAAIAVLKKEDAAQREYAAHILEEREDAFVGFFRIDDFFQERCGNAAFLTEFVKPL